jgi:hypothetical protein
MHNLDGRKITPTDFLSVRNSRECDVTYITPAAPRQKDDVKALCSKESCPSHQIQGLTDCRI